MAGFKLRPRNIVRVGTTATLPSPTTDLTSHRVILIPFLDCDDATGRLYGVVGQAACDVTYEQTLTDGSASLALSDYSGHVSSPIYLATSQAGNGNCPFKKGVNIGSVPAAGEVMLPDALVILPQEGSVRVGVRRYDPSQALALTIGPAWRDTPDLGLTWADGTVAVAVGTPISSPPKTRALLNGSARQRRTDALAESGEPAAGRPTQGGASGWLEMLARFSAFLRLPLWASRAAGSAPPSPFTGTGPTASNPGGVSAAARRTTDSGLHVSAASAAPTTGSLDTTLLSVPGYPCAGDWAGYAPFSGPIFGFPPDGDGTLSWLLAGGKMPVVSPAGGLVWARGDTGGSAGWLFCPAIMRPPLLRDSYVPTGANAIEEGFKQDTDSETATTGKDWGHKTCIVYAETVDSGENFGDLRVLATASGPVIATTETVRIAACTGRGGSLFALVASQGTATLYESQDTRHWKSVGQTADGGATWTSLP